MPQLFLTSNFYAVAPMIGRMIEPRPAQKKTLFITTATETKKGELSWLEEDKKTLADLGMEAVEYTLTGKTPADFARDFADQPHIFMSGGNTFYLLQQAQQSGFSAFITEYLTNSDVLYFGSSAGSVIAGPDIDPVRPLDDPAEAPLLQGTRGFGLVDLCLLPHWGGESFRQAYKEKGFQYLYTQKHKLVLLTDNQFVHVAADGVYRLLEI